MNTYFNLHRNFGKFLFGMQGTKLNLMQGKDVLMVCNNYPEKEIKWLQNEGLDIKSEAYYSNPEIEIHYCRMCHCRIITYKTPPYLIGYRLTLKQQP